MNSTMLNCGLSDSQDYKLHFIFIYIIVAYTLLTLSFLMTLCGHIPTTIDIMKHIKGIEAQLAVMNSHTNRRMYP